jgi:lysophospholipase L1-like esterase
MRLNNKLLVLFFGLSFILNMSVLSCNTKAEIPYVAPYAGGEDEEESEEEEEQDDEAPRTFKLLSLGDSYTIGQSVCIRCRFPEQLKDSLIENFNSQDIFSLEIIAQTGWTTTNLKSAIASANPTADFDLVTLLIGVNNQYQNKPFSLYQTEFIELVDTAISLVGGEASNLIVVSIPDYAYTPFGQNSNSETISAELETYNNYAQNYCNTNGLTYVYITDITQQGLNNPDLVASDNLHPSSLAYSKFVERILPFAIEKIE